MRDEIANDLSRGAVYYSPRLTASGRAIYLNMLDAAADSGSDVTLAAAVAASSVLEVTEMSHRNGVPYVKRVPSNAAQVLAEGDFNRYYIRALCLKTLSEGGTEVEVYRARPSGWTRAGSDLLIGTRLSAATLLEDLRRNADHPEALSVLPDVNSGLSVLVI